MNFNGSTELIAISENTSWLGNNETKEIYSFDTYPDNKNEASWLIDAEFAILLKAYQADYFFD